jgi:hypothetical protein
MYSLRILIVFALADISLRYIELPVRRGVINYWFKGLKYRTSAEQKRETIQYSVIAAVLVLSIAVISMRAIAIGNEAREAVIASVTDSEIVESATDDGIWLTGDSVILGIKSVLAEKFTVSLVNARIGRQAPELLSEIIHDQADAPTGPVVLNLGNNNAVSEDQVVAILETLKDSDKVILVNTAVPRPWRDSNNEVISMVSARYGNVQVVDWSTISEGHPEYFAPDGIHLVTTGVNVYVDSIAKYLD